MIGLKTFKVNGKDGEGIDIWVGNEPVIPGVKGYRIFIHKDNEDKLNSKFLIDILEEIIKHLNK